jgi:phosphate-selective porin OprO/OprP
MMNRVAEYSLRSVPGLLVFSPYLKQGEHEMRNWSVKLATVFVVLLAMAGAAVAGSSPLNATAEDGILVFESDDSAFKWWLDARAYVDVAAYFDDGPLYYSEDDFEDPDDWADYEDEFGGFFERQNSLTGGVILRRARLAIKSQLWGDWYSEVDFDFAEEAAAVKDAYISYRGLFNGKGRVRVGNFRQPFGLEEVTSSRNISFMERSQGTEPFVVGRRMGLEVTQWLEKFRWSVSVFGGDVEDFVKESNERASFAARVNYTPILEEDSVLMIGAAGTMQKPTFVDFDIDVDTRPETNVSDTKFVDAKYKDVDKYSVFGGELAYVNKRLRVQGEYMMASYSFLEGADWDGDVSNNGGYVYATYFLTDDGYTYDHKDAEFARLVPSSKKGAWEVAARYSFVSLNDDDVLEDGDPAKYGASTSITLGVNYYPNPNIRCMLNYGIVDNDEFAISRGDYKGDYDFQYLSMRFMTAF